MAILFTFLGIYIQKNNVQTNFKQDSGTQNNNTGNGTQNNNNSNGVTINPSNTSTGTLIIPTNLGNGLQNNATNTGLGSQTNYFNPKINLPQFEKRPLIDADDKLGVRVLDTGKIKNLVFPFKNYGNVPATDCSLTFFLFTVKYNIVSLKDTIPIKVTIDTLEQGLSRTWFYNLLPENLNDTLIFYVKLRYFDKKKFYSPEPYVFIYPKNYFNKDLIFLKNDIKAIIKKVAIKYGG